jgi:tRNA pseudouridine55 synthase
MNGVLHVIKPPGMTSSNLVVALKKILNTKKIGHTGTLDPGACGVLFICVGRATKAAGYLIDGKKAYIAEFAFGTATDTLDSYGTVTQNKQKQVSFYELKEACAAFTGALNQVPPMVSAIKVNGQKMYQLARKGKKISLPARRVTVYSIETLEFDEANRTCLLRIECSKGTYIRSLCADMAEKMGTAGHVSFLLRTSAGGADIRDAYTLDEIKGMAEKGDYGFLRSMDEALSVYPECVLEDYLFPIVTTGTPIDLAKTRNGSLIPRDEDIRVYCGGQFIGMGRADGDILKINTMIYLEETG